MMEPLEPTASPRDKEERAARISRIERVYDVLLTTKYFRKSPNQDGLRFLESIFVDIREKWIRHMYNRITGESNHQWMASPCVIQRKLLATSFSPFATVTREELAFCRLSKDDARLCIGPDPDEPFLNLQ